MRRPERWEPARSVCRKRLFALMGALVLAASTAAAQRMPATAVAAAPQLLEYQVKAAFLLNFTKFIEWPSPEPPSPGLPFTLCIFGEDPFGPALAQITQDETVNGRKLVVLRPEAGNTKSCQMIYFGKPDKGKEALDGIGTGILTVGEGEAFIRDGGMIAFVLENRRVRFVINLTATRNGKLTVSSRLLAVAKAVEK